jgi:exosortase/archaeosortase
MAVSRYGRGAYGRGPYSRAAFVIHEAGGVAALTLTGTAGMQVVKEVGHCATQLTFSLTGSTALTFDPLPICTAGGNWQKAA